MLFNPTHRMMNILLKKTTFLSILIILTNFISCKKDSSIYITVETNSRFSYDAKKVDSNMIRNNGKTSYYTNPEGGCTGYIDYKYGFILANPNFDNYLDPFKARFREHLQTNLNIYEQGYFVVTQDNIQFSGVNSQWDYTNYNQYFIMAFRETENELQLGVVLDANRITLNPFGIQCSQTSPPITISNPTPGEDEGGSGGGTSPLFILNLNDRLLYPSLAKIIDNLYNKVKKDTKLMSALIEYSNLSEQSILQDMKTGQGPTIRVVPKSQLMGGAIAEFDHANMTIKFSDEAAYDSNYFSTTFPTATEFYLTACILHEYIHFGENMTQIFIGHAGRLDDAGFQFENKYYGGRLEYNKVTGIVTYYPL